MKLSVIAIVLSFVGTSANAAGLAEIKIPTDAKGRPAIDAVVWSPCAVAPKDISIQGSFPIPGVRDCSIEGTDLPLVMMSHGMGGNFASHFDVAESLADDGFIVVALTHVLDSGRDLKKAMDTSSMVERPTDVKRVMDYVLRSSKYRAVIDSNRIGFFGFSRGGFTGLVLAGAVAKLPRTMDSLVDFAPGPPTLFRSPDQRIKVFVVADPLSLFPDKASLAEVTAPIQLWGSQFGGEGVRPKDVKAIADNLPTKPEFHVVPNAAHLSFLFPCPPAVAKAAHDICVDPPGFDRAAFHKRLDEQVVAFFAKHLKQNAH